MDRAQLLTQYLDGLRAWLEGDAAEGGGEAALSAAYDLGRAAMAAGFGLFELVSLHNEAALRLERDGGLLAGDERMVQYFAEAVAPFEMALRGYQETNKRLQGLNELLSTQNEELREAQREAAAANRELEAFSSRAAHDLRSPLNVVDGFAQLLLEEPGLDDRGRSWLGEIRGGVARMLQLIHELLQLSRSTGAELRRERVDVTELCDIAIARLRAAQPRRHVDVVIQPGMVTRADPHLLLIVLENLLGNAWKFTGKTEHPKVEVGVDAAGSFFVKDNGAGFDAQKAAKLFTPFVRLHSSSEFDGTGIGLATVARILQRHGGSIKATASPGAGACFSFTTEPAAAPHNNGNGNGNGSNSNGNKGEGATATG